jgi:hypothetical protein
MNRIANRRFARLRHELLESRVVLTASYTFVPHQAPSLSGSSSSALLADIDGDQDLDAVFWAETDQGTGVHWAERISADRFSEARLLWSGPASRIVQAIDREGDGDLDLVMATNDRVFWLNNLDGQGQFAAEDFVAPFDGLSRFEAISVVDFNGDGSLDVLAAIQEYNGHAAYVILMDGSGSQSPQRIGEIGGEQAYDIQAADLDGDGDLDVVTSAEDGAIVGWFRNDGNAFSELLVISRPADERDRAFALGDFDGDGDLDIAAMSASGWVAWFENDGTGAISTEHVVSTRDLSVRTILAGDFNGDGSLDIATASTDDVGDIRGLVLHFNRNGRGDFDDRETVVIANYEVGGVRQAVGPDGVEFVLGAGGSTIVLGPTAPSDVYIEIAVVAQTPSGHVETIGQADIDGDGRPNVVIGDSREGSLIWFEPAQDFSTAIGHSITRDAFGLQTVSLGDVDGDGDIDVVATTTGEGNAASSRLVWYENDGTGRRFTAHETELIRADEFDTILADLDGDGDLDLLQIRTFEDETVVVWLEFLADQNRFAATSIAIANLPAGIARFGVADYEQDGDLDVLISHVNSQTGVATAHWYENLDGLGTFIQGDSFFLPEVGVYSLALVDIDQDNDLDVLIGGYSAGTVTLYCNVNGLNQPMPATVVESNGPGALAMAKASDLDDDGDLDIYTTFTSTGDAAFYKQSQPCQFDAGRSLSDLPAGANLEAVDLNHDRRADLFVLGENTSPRRVQWFENRVIGDLDGDGLFTSSDLVLVFQAGEYEDGIRRNSTFQTGDWNGDGEFDSADLVFAFQAGHYSTGANPASVEAVDHMFALAAQNANEDDSRK